MLDLPPRQLAAWAAGIALVVVLGLFLLRRDGPSAPSASPVPIRVQDDAGGGGGGGRVFVHVAGAVRHPGVYTLRAGSRVADAVERAGGPRASADLTAVNLASKLEDGRQVLVPRRLPAPGGASTVTAPGAGAAGGSAPGLPQPPVDLNTATLEQLDTLDGVGPATAQKILEYRQQHGGFSSVEELTQVPGIGEKRMAALREKVRV